MKCVLYWTQWKVFDCDLFISMYFTQSLVLSAYIHPPFLCFPVQTTQTTATTSSWSECRAGEKPRRFLQPLLSSMLLAVPGICGHALRNPLKGGGRNMCLKHLSLSLLYLTVLLLKEWLLQLPSSSPPLALPLSPMNDYMYVSWGQWCYSCCLCVSGVPAMPKLVYCLFEKTKQNPTTWEETLA